MEESLSKPVTVPICTGAKSFKQFGSLPPNDGFPLSLRRFKGVL